MQHNFDDFKNKIFLDKFFHDCENYKVDKQTYDVSYPEFLNYFSNLKNITKHNLVIGINFTYGWMPTIFDFRYYNFDEAVEILNNAKKGVIPSVYQLELLKGLFNNSLVGTAKLLHFINPEKFAIWDSRVYRYLTEKEPYHDRIGNCETYLSFLTFCDFLTKRNEFEKAHKSICDKFGYAMTKLRTAEVIMYINGGKKKVGKSSKQTAQSNKGQH